MWKIRDFYDINKDWLYKESLLFIQKWNFYILLNEEAFFFSKIFYFKMTKLDNKSIKVGFPIYAVDKWIKNIEEKGIWYTFFDSNKEVVFKQKWSYIEIDEWDYQSAYKRILQKTTLIKTPGVKKDFLLKKKVEWIYKDFLFHIVKACKKERFFIREKVEKVFLNILEKIYDFMYNLDERDITIRYIFNKLLILKEFFVFIHFEVELLKETVYIDLSERLVEVLKITKRIKSSSTQLNSS